MKNIVDILTDADSIFEENSICAELGLLLSYIQHGAYNNCGDL